VIGSSIPPEAISVELTAGAVTNDINISLDAGGAISGTICDTDGLPIDHMQITVSTLTGIQQKYTYTDTNGLFQIVGLPAGIWTIRAGTYFTSYSDEATTLVLAAEQIVSHVDFMLSRSVDALSGIRFKVTDTNDVPISSVRFRLRRTDLDPLVGLPLVGLLLAGPMYSPFWNSTDNNGEYLWSSIDPGTYDVTTDASQLNYVNETRSNITVGANITNFSFSLREGSIISGTITGQAPLPGVHVQPYTDTGRGLISHTTTDTNGYYEIRGLPTGSYFLLADPPTEMNAHNAWYGDIIDEGSGIPLNAIGITATEGTSVSNIDFALAEGGGFSGTVTDAAGRPQNQAHLSVYDTNSHYVTYANTRSDGTYQIAGLSSDQYYVRATQYGENLLPEWYDNIRADGLPPPGAVAINVPSLGIVSNIDFSLSFGGRIQGQVTRESGAPVPNLRIETSRGYAATTDTYGHYQIDSLTTGVYQVTTDAEDQALIDNSATVTVTVGEVSKADIVLSRKALTISISGTEGQRPRLSWRAGRYVAYQIQYTTDLCSPWQNAPNGVLEHEKSLRAVTTASDLEYAFPEHTNGPVFFRATLVE
jgi:hypothetical protein